MKIDVDLRKCDFDFWSNNKIKVLLIFVERKQIDDIRFLTLVTNLGYATLHRIVKEFEERGLVVRDGRRFSLCENWVSFF